jgi:hypothetical protein
MQNYLKSALKKLQNTYVFKHPKMAFYFWTKPFGTWKKRKNNTKSRRDGTRVFEVLKTRLIPKNLAIFPKVNNRKSFKKH